MNRLFTFLAAAVVLAAVAPSLADAQTYGPTRSHITLGLGYASHTSSDFDDSGMESGMVGQLGYRYTINTNFDVTFDYRTLWTGDTQVVDDGGGPMEMEFGHDTTFMGPGARWTSNGGNVRPYAQANIFYATETLSVAFDGMDASADESGVGFGFMGGVDIRVSDLLSIPVEGAYMYAKPENDVSTLGFSAGLTFNLSPMP